MQKQTIQTEELISTNQSSDDLSHLDDKPIGEMSIGTLLLKAVSHLHRFEETLRTQWGLLQKSKHSGPIAKREVQIGNSFYPVPKFLMIAYDRATTIKYLADTNNEFCQVVEALIDHGLKELSIKKLADDMHGYSQVLEEAVQVKPGTTMTLTRLEHFKSTIKHDPATPQEPRSSMAIHGTFKEVLLAYYKS